MSKKHKGELLFSVTKDDCRMDVFCSGGKGGQHQNKTASGVRFVHEPSGAVGESREYRSQPQNKEAAWRRMAESDKFIRWCKFHAMELSGEMRRIERLVDDMMDKRNLKIEVLQDGKWVEQE